MKRTALCLMLVAAAGWAGTVGTHGNGCKRTYRISGERADGSGPMDTEITVTQRCYDFDPAGIAAEEASDRQNYESYAYQKIGSPSWRQDCAGYAFQKLFGEGPYWVEAGNLFDQVILWYGRRVYNPNDRQATWGDVRAGDIVVYRSGGVAKHIAVVNRLETTAGAGTTLWIETKESQHPVYLHRVGYFEWSSDPLVQQFGAFHIYRLDPAALEVKLVSKTCECPPLPAAGTETAKPKPQGEGEGEVATADVPKVDDKGPSPPSEEESWGGRWKGWEKATVFMDGIDPVVQEVAVEFRIEDLGGTVRLTSPADGKSSVLKKLRSNPNACMEKKERQEPLLAAVAAMGATGGTSTKETLVLFLREGRLYLAQRIVVETRMTQTIGEETIQSNSKVATDAIGIFDRVK